MPATRKFIGISSVTVGVLLLLFGIASIGFYIYSVIDVLGKADQSKIFWYLVFVLVGITLITAGIYFIWIGYKSSKEKNYSGLAKYSLVGFCSIIVVLILSVTFGVWSADKKRAERINDEEIMKSLKAGMHQIERIKIATFDQTGFSFSVHISEGEKGLYRLIMLIDNGQAIFLEEAEEFEMDGSERELTRSIRFDQLFQKCFDQFRGSNIYACIQNTGAKTHFTLELQLILVQDMQQKITHVKNNVSLTSTGHTEFAMDTFTDNTEVKVNYFQPIDR